MRLAPALLVTGVFLAGTPGALAQQALPHDAKDAFALQMADEYIKNGRQAAVSLRLAGVAPGTPVQVRLARHAFHFGINVPGTFNRFLIEGAPPASGLPVTFVLAVKVVMFAICAAGLVATLRSARKTGGDLG